MDEYKFFLPCSLYSQFEPSLSELTNQGVKIDWIENPFRNLGEINKHAEQCALVGKAYMEVTGSSKINNIKVKDIWIDEAISFAPVVWTTKEEPSSHKFFLTRCNKIKFIARCIRQHFGIDALDFENRTLIISSRLENYAQS
jgi:hypothetical protein